MMLNRPLFVLSLFLACAPAGAEEVALERIAFGSCAKQDKPQPIWDAVVELKPQRFLFLGDNIYGDSTDIAVLREKWALLGEQPGYKKLKETCPVLATWDDHDYGADDAGVEFPLKKESQQAFLDFFGAPADDIRRTRDGVYSAEITGPPGKRVQIILLDSRFFRSPLVKSAKKLEPGEGYRGKYGENVEPGATMLGEAQWAWFEKQLRTPAEVRIIGSSVQIVAMESGWENWANFPNERKRFFQLLRDTKANGVVLLSGDRHLAEMSRLPAGDGGPAYPLLDITSSSLNAPSGNMTKAGVRFANELNQYRVGLTFFDTNFGSILIDWSESDPVIRAQVRDEKGGVVLQQRMSLGQLK